MAIPSEYRDHQPTIGCTDIKHPVITFRVLRQRQTEEGIGPITNQRTGTVLHPDMHDSSPDRGNTNKVQHQTQIWQWFPGLIPGNNLYVSSDGTFTAYGQQATYLKTQYADITNPLLEVVS